MKDPVPEDFATAGNSIGPAHLRITEVSFLKPQMKTPRVREGDSLTSAMRDTDAMVRALQGK